MKKFTNFVQNSVFLILFNMKTNFRRNSGSTSHHMKSTYTSHFKWASAVFSNIHSNKFLKCSFAKKKRTSFLNNFPGYTNSAEIVASFLVPSSVLRFPGLNIINTIFHKVLSPWVIKFLENGIWFCPKYYSKHPRE